MDSNIINPVTTEALVQSAQELFKIDRVAALGLAQKYTASMTAAGISSLAGNPIAKEALEDYTAQLTLDLATLGVQNEAALEGKIQGWLFTSLALLLKVA